MLGFEMHAVFKDDGSRVVDSVVGRRQVEDEEWLRARNDAVVCEVYEDDSGVRGKLVTVYVRDPTTGRWSRH